MLDFFLKLPTLVGAMFIQVVAVIVYARTSIWFGTEISKKL